MCFRLSRGKLEKRLETGAHVVVKTHEWTGLISPKTFDEAKELFSHLDWTGIGWRFLRISRIIMVNSVWFSIFWSWNLNLFWAVFWWCHIRQNQRCWFVKWPWWDLTRRDVSRGHVVVSVRENFDADPDWMKLRAEGLKWTPKLQSFYSECIHDKLEFRYPYVSTQIWGSHPFFWYKHFQCSSYIYIYMYWKVCTGSRADTFDDVRLNPKLRPRKVATHEIHFEELVAYDKALTTTNCEKLWSVWPFRIFWLLWLIEFIIRVFPFIRECTIGSAATFPHRITCWDCASPIHLDRFP